MSVKINPPKLASDHISKVPFVGPKVAAAFLRLGVKTVEDLFRYLPRESVDLSKPVLTAEALRREGEKLTVYGEIRDLKVIKTPRRRIWLTTAKIEDKSGEIKVVWFNQPYLRNFFKEGKYAFYGPIEYNQFAKGLTIVSPAIYDRPGVITVYNQTEGLSSKQIQRTVKNALDSGYKIEELVPDKSAEKLGLLSDEEAVLKLHFPKNTEEFYRAKERLIFDSLLVFISANLFLKNQNNQKKALKVVCDSKILDDFIEQLPFKLTEDQNEAVDDFIGDFKRSYPMNRLVQGDVGSGKTVVALLAAHLAIKSGFKTAYLAPTQILARQHFETARKLMPNNTEILLLTATSRSKDINERIKKADLVIGTHALIQKDIKIDNLALVIVDEQHRFGVDQREYLLKTGRVAPHLLSLSATPIPRTLAHIIFGNLDVSTIFEKPSGRLEVKTYLIPENKRADSYRFIEKLISTGQQAFVVCPLIEQKSGSADGRLFDVLDRKAVESEMRNLQKTVLAKRKIESLHGRMKGEDKEEKMQRMQNGAIDIMVSTSVVEVGVDVPNATIMVVEGAQHFGLSQLHQFRGRVGRNKMQSYCFLFTDENLNDKTKERLKVFVQNSDGFKLSEMDLRQRGPGAVLGVDQSGFVGINPLWFENTEVLRKASKLAGDLVQDLENMPDLFSKVKEKLETKHLE